jgi:hypothetical protein
LAVKLLTKADMETKTIPYTLVERAWCEPISAEVGDMPPKCFDCHEEDFATYMVRYEQKNTETVELTTAVCYDHMASRRRAAEKHGVPWIETRAGA